MNLLVGIPTSSVRILQSHHRIGFQALQHYLLRGNIPNHVVEGGGTSFFELHALDSQMDHRGRCLYSEDRRSLKIIETSCTCHDALDVYLDVPGQLLFHRPGPSSTSRDTFRTTRPKLATERRQAEGIASGNTALHQGQTSA